MSNHRNPRRRNPIALLARTRGGAGRHRPVAQTNDAAVIAEHMADPIHPRELPCSDTDCEWCHSSWDDDAYSWSDFIDFAATTLTATFHEFM